MENICGHLSLFCISVLRCCLFIKIKYPAFKPKEIMIVVCKRQIAVLKTTHNDKFSTLEKKVNFKNFFSSLHTNNSFSLNLSDKTERLRGCNVKPYAYESAEMHYPRIY